MEQPLHQLEKKQECNCGQIMGSSSSVHSRYMEENEMLSYFRKKTWINQIPSKKGDSVSALGIY